MLDLYKNIKKLRLEQGLSQEDLAKQTGYSDRSSIAKIEAGGVDLTQSKIKLFADALGTTPIELMGWDEEEERPSFEEMLKQFRQRLGLSQAELAQRLGLGASTISMYEAGKRQPDFKTEEAIADFFGVDIDTLRGRNKSKPERTIPVYDRVAAGIPLEAIDNIVDYEEIPAHWVGEYAGFRVKGDSMTPRIQEGDYLIVRKQSDADSGDIVIAFVNGEDATVKKLIKQENGITLQPFNPAYEPMYFSNEQIEQLPVTIWGKVVENRQKF